MSNTKKLLGQEKKNERDMELLKKQKLQTHLSKRPKKTFDKLTQKEKDEMYEAMLQWWMEQ